MDRRRAGRESRSLRPPERPSRSSERLRGEKLFDVLPRAGSRGGRGGGPDVVALELARAQRTVEIEALQPALQPRKPRDRKSTRLNSSHVSEYRRPSSL